MPDSLPLSENRRAIPWHWVVLGLLVVAHAGLGSYYNSIGTDLFRSKDTMLAGLLSSQPLLLAFWAAFAPQRFYDRILWSLLLCILVSFTVDCGVWLHVNANGYGYGLGFLMLADSILFVMAIPILLLIRH